MATPCVEPCPSWDRVGTKGIVERASRARMARLGVASRRRRRRPCSWQVAASSKRSPGGGKAVWRGGSRVGRSLGRVDVATPQGHCQSYRRRRPRRSVGRHRRDCSPGGMGVAMLDAGGSARPLGRVDAATPQGHACGVEQSGREKPEIPWSLPAVWILSTSGDGGMSTSTLVSSFVNRGRTSTGC